MYSFLQTPSLDVMGQEIGMSAVLFHSHVEYLKDTVTMMMSVLAICYVEQTTASLHFIGLLTAAMTPFQVSKYLTVIAQIAFMDLSWYMCPCLNSWSIYIDFASSHLSKKLQNNKIGKI